MCVKLLLNTYIFYIIKQTVFYLQYLSSPNKVLRSLFLVFQLVIPEALMHPADFRSCQNLMKPDGVVAGVWLDTTKGEERARPSLIQKAQLAKVQALN